MENPTASQQTAASSAVKVRILLQTVTHLVPGVDRAEKITSIRDLICQHHWKRNFDFSQGRWAPYKDHFGFDNRRCFFLVDHHGYDHTAQEEEVPVLWYKWTGESLVQIHQELPSKLLRKLKKWPFTWEGRKFHTVPKGPDGEYHPKDRRENIKSDLYHGATIVNKDIEFLREYPEHAQWLKTHMDPRLWSKIEPFCDLPKETEAE